MTRSIKFERRNTGELHSLSHFVVSTIQIFVPAHFDFPCYKTLSHTILNYPEGMLTEQKHK